MNALTCPILAIFEDLCCFLEIILNADGPLFPGSDDSQAKHFGDIFDKIKRKHEHELNEMG
jgi:hypothetical protein